MSQNLPNDSILLPEGIVEDDIKVMILHKSFEEILSGDLFEENREKDKEGE